MPINKPLTTAQLKHLSAAQRCAYHEHSRQLAILRMALKTVCYYMGKDYEVLMRDAELTYRLRKDDGNA